MWCNFPSPFPSSFRKSPVNAFTLHESTYIVTCEVSLSSLTNMLIGKVMSSHWHWCQVKCTRHTVKVNSLRTHSTHKPVVLRKVDQYVTRNTLEVIKVYWVVNRTVSIEYHTPEPFISHLGYMGIYSIIYPVCCCNAIYSLHLGICYAAECRWTVWTRTAHRLL